MCARCGTVSIEKAKIISCADKSSPFVFVIAGYFGVMQNTQLNLKSTNNAEMCRRKDGACQTKIRPNAELLYHLKRNSAVCR